MTVIHGDCLEYIKTLESGSVDMVYMDPPFFTQQSHSLSGRNNSGKYSFEDTWESLDAYCAFLRDRIAECHRVLKNTGSIFLHCDKHASHHIRTLLDAVFDPSRFVNEIIWSYKRWSNSKKGLQNAHQTIFLYAKSDDFTFNTIYDEYSATTNIDQILQERTRGDDGKSRYKYDGNNAVVMGVPKKGVPLGDVWNIPYLNPKARERVGYPTQKPVLLLERIIEISTHENDVVLDPFCGSGTTLVAAALLNRRHIGIDISPDAVAIANGRLRAPSKTSSLLLENGEGSYINKTEREIRILKELGAFPVQRNAGIDGFLKEGAKPIPVKIQAENETIAEARAKLVKAAKMRCCDSMILVRMKADNQLFPEDAGGYDDNILLIDAPGFAATSWIKERQRVLA